MTFACLIWIGFVLRVAAQHSNLSTRKSVAAPINGQTACRYQLNALFWHEFRRQDICSTGFSELKWHWRTQFASSTNEKRISDELQETFSRSFAVAQYTRKRFLIHFAFAAKKKFINHLAAASGNRQRLLRENHFRVVCVSAGRMALTDPITFIQTAAIDFACTRLQSDCEAWRTSPSFSIRSSVGARWTTHISKW